VIFTQPHNDGLMKQNAAHRAIRSAMEPVVELVVVEVSFVIVRQ
jgi:hypothetical protein